MLTSSQQNGMAALGDVIESTHGVVTCEQIACTMQTTSIDKGNWICCPSEATCYSYSFWCAIVGNIPDALRYWSCISCCVVVIHITVWRSSMYALPSPLYSGLGGTLQVGSLQQATLSQPPTGHMCTRYSLNAVCKASLAHMPHLIDHHPRHDGCMSL